MGSRWAEAVVLWGWSSQAVLRTWAVAWAGLRMWGWDRAEVVHKVFGHCVADHSGYTQFVAVHSGYTHIGAVHTEAVRIVDLHFGDSHIVAVHYGADLLGEAHSEVVHTAEPQPEGESIGIDHIEGVDSWNYRIVVVNACGLAHAWAASLTLRT